MNLGFTGDTEMVIWNQKRLVSASGGYLDRNSILNFLFPHLPDASLCSHIVYSYFGIEAGTHELKWLDPYLMKDLRK